MPNPAIGPASNPPESNALADTDVCAVFVIAASGHVVAANVSARQLWSAGSRPLVALPFASLFYLEPVNDDAELTIQWQTLKSEACDRWNLRMALPFAGPPRETRLRIERAFGGGGSYIATVQPLSHSR